MLPVHVIMSYYYCMLFTLLHLFLELHFHFASFLNQNQVTAFSLFHLPSFLFSPRSLRPTPLPSTEQFTGLSFTF